MTEVPRPVHKCAFIVSWTFVKFVKEKYNASHIRIYPRAMTIPTLLPVVFIKDIFQAPFQGLSEVLSTISFALLPRFPSPDVSMKAN